jgi:hypothetical protein
MAVKNLNVFIEEAEFEAAKQGAARAGMLLKRWVGRAILRAEEAERPATRHERTYEQIEGE